MENATQNSNGVELKLLGIDKTWIRYKGEWRDKSEIESKPPIEITIHEPEKKKSRGWKFWKKRPVDDTEMLLEQDL